MHCASNATLLCGQDYVKRALFTCIYRMAAKTNSDPTNDLFDIFVALPSVIVTL